MSPGSVLTRAGTTPGSDGSLIALSIGMLSNEHGNRQTTSAEQLARGLGWFSIGLGLAELAAPGSIARLTGMNDRANSTTLQAFGARQFANGIAILAQPDSSKWLWSRVGGDALDLSYLASALGEEGADRGRISRSIAALIGVTALDVLAAAQLTRSSGTNATARRSSRRVRVEKVITVNRPIPEVYQFWRSFENLPQFMRHLHSVESLGGGRSRWRAKAPAGFVVEWEAEILQDREYEWIAWRSVEGSEVENSGSVRFKAAPGARGTELRVQLQYSPPAGAFGRTIARLFGEAPEQQIEEDLKRFKQLMEAGEIAVSDGPGLWRPAQPSAEEKHENRFAEGVRR
jgi:uncharacterized membrane protein